MQKVSKSLLVSGLILLSLGVFLPALADNGSSFLGMMNNMSSNHMNDGDYEDMMGDNYDMMDDDHDAMMSGNHMMDSEVCDSDSMSHNDFEDCLEEEGHESIEDCLNDEDHSNYDNCH